MCEEITTNSAGDATTADATTAGLECPTGHVAECSPETVNVGLVHMIELMETMVERDTGEKDVIDS